MRFVVVGVITAHCNTADAMVCDVSNVHKYNLRGQKWYPFVTNEGGGARNVHAPYCGMEYRLTVH